MKKKNFKNFFKNVFQKVVKKKASVDCVILFTTKHRSCVHDFHV